LSVPSARLSPLTMMRILFLSKFLRTNLNHSPVRSNLKRAPSETSLSSQIISNIPHRALSRRILPDDIAALRAGCASIPLLNSPSSIHRVPGRQRAIGLCNLEFNPAMAGNIHPAMRIAFGKVNFLAAAHRAFTRFTHDCLSAVRLRHRLLLAMSTHRQNRHQNRSNHYQFRNQKN